jgi:hypothetical protein
MGTFFFLIVRGCLASKSIDGVLNEGLYTLLYPIFALLCKGCRGDIFFASRSGVVIVYVWIFCALRLERDCNKHSEGATGQSIFIEI